MAKRPEAKVVRLHFNSGKGGQAHPSSPRRAKPASAARPAPAAVGAIERCRDTVGQTAEAPRPLAQRVTAVAEFIRRRVTGDYTVDEFGFDPHLHDGLVMPVLRNLWKWWCRIEVTGIEHLPANGAALVVVNHTGLVPSAELMCSVIVHDRHPAHRTLRLLTDGTVLDVPMIRQAVRVAGTTARTADMERLLARGELTAAFSSQYKRLDALVSAALRTRSPIVPCTIVGPKWLYPTIAPMTQYIDFGTPIRTTHFDGKAADDGAVTLKLANQLREIFEHAGAQSRISAAPVSTASIRDARNLRK